VQSRYSGLAHSSVLKLFVDAVVGIATGASKADGIHLKRGFVVKPPFEPACFRSVLTPGPPNGHLGDRQVHKGHVAYEIQTFRFLIERFVISIGERLDNGLDPFSSPTPPSSIKIWSSIDRSLKCHSKTLCGPRPDGRISTIASVKAKSPQQPRLHPSTRWPGQGMTFNRPTISSTACSLNSLLSIERTAIFRQIIGQPTLASSFPSSSPLTITRFRSNLWSVDLSPKSR